MKKLIYLLSLTLLWVTQMQGVTFKVQVPEGTLKCYVCGDFNGWDVTSCPQLTQTGDNLFTLEMPDVSEADAAKGYKYVCGQDWKYVEKDANGGEINNRTSIGNPDIVESWATVNLWDIKNHDLTVNGLPRQIQVYLPKGYEDSSESYPVIYYNTVQQRYSNAGADDDNGDNFFGSLSWNAQASMESLRETTGKAYIMVQICSMLGENTVSEHNDYKGTGESHKYLDAFTGELIPFIEKTYRVKSGKDNTVIVGADFGALFSMYAAVTKPEVFGSSVIMSPMLWINEGEYEQLASRASEGQTYYVSAGSREPEWLINNTEILAEELKKANGANVYFTLYNNAAHNDDDWGKSFVYVLEGLATNSAPQIEDETPEPDEFSKSVFTLYAGEDSGKLNKIGTMIYTDEYHKIGENVSSKAFVITYPIAAQYKSKFYWNIEIGEEGSNEWLLPSPNSIGFSSSRSEISWHNVALFEDNSIQNTAAHSKGFRVVCGSNTKMMDQESEFISKATVPFTTEKSFVIKFGSVNSNSEQSALTPSISVSENCTEAEITYDFALNKVTVKETKVEEGEKEDPLPETEFKSRSYTVYGSDNSENLQPVGKMIYTEEFRASGSDTPVEAFVFTNDIPVEYKSTYYWNISLDGEGQNNWVLPNAKTITFSDKKNETSWHTIALYENGTTSDIAAHSKGFRVVAGNNTTMMNHAGNHLSKLTVAFPGTDKTFQINYGSVNSSSDMGAITPKMKVSNNCLEAEITYDFTLNKVSVSELKFGDPAENLKVVEFSAVPAVAKTDDNIAINLVLNKACEVSVSFTNSSGANVPVNLTRTANSSYSASLSNLNEGVYTMSLTLKDGDNVSTGVNPLNIRVIPESEGAIRELTVNAYEDVDWNNIGRYKANFHTHTSQSFDTNYTTTQVVDKYQKANYQILALTDHDANSFPWSMFSLYNPNAEDRDAESMGMLSIPGNELSKDRRNSWSESTGGEFNHHNDFFTGRKGQEFMSLRESYAYTQAIGGLQIINHPGQYWNLSTEYKKGEKNSPEWHAENFKLYDSLVGLEVYNQGNRRPNDRILWDQILTLTMPERPVWGYSCDDTHTEEQYFRNYQYMLMPDLSVPALKEAMKGGNTVFSYEYTGSGMAMAPHVESIEVDKSNKTITIDTDDADTIEWIYSTYRTGSAASTTKNAIVGYGKTFDFTDFQGSYVRARLVNSYGETATQPFGFSVTSTSANIENLKDSHNGIRVINHPGSEEATVISTEPMLRISVVNAGGAIVRFAEVNNETSYVINKADLTNGVYVIVVATENAAYTAKFIK